MKDTRKDDAIRELLRSGDPAAEETLDAADVHRMRRRILVEPQGRSPVASLRAAFAAGIAVVVLVAAVAVWRGRTASPPEAADSSPAVTAPAGGGQGDVMPAGVRPARTIHFVTPSGTRVIWKLDPNFTLYPERQPAHS